jgi:hypothetical protein
MKTAVEWLIETHFGSIENCTPDFRNKIKQAKEMEKQQIIDAYIKGNYKSNRDMYWKVKSAEEYYKETFKQDETD